MGVLTGDILIVDDERSLREFLAIFLRRTGHRVEAAADVDAARKAMAEREFDVVITDLQDARRQRPRRPGRIEAPAPRHPGHRGDRLCHRRDRHRRHEGGRLRLPHQAVQGGRGGAGGRTGPRAPGAPAPERRPARRDQGALQARPSDRQVPGHAPGVRGGAQDRLRPHQRAADRRVRHRQGAGRARPARAVGPGRKRLHRGQLRGHPRIAHRVGVLRPRQRRPSPAPTPIARACSRPPTAAPSSSTRSASCPSPMQVKLLRVLQERKVKRVGGVQEKEVDVRVVAATNRDLETEVEKGTFRQDLFYRLNVIQLRLPPLRERREDIPILVDHFVRKLAAEHGRQITGVDPDAMSALMGHSFPGNVRELENLIERAVTLAPGDRISSDTLPTLSPHSAAGARAGPGARAARRGAGPGEGGGGLRARHPHQGPGAHPRQPHRSGPPAGRHLPFLALPAVQAGHHRRRSRAARPPPRMTAGRSPARPPDRPPVRRLARVAGAGVLLLPVCAAAGQHRSAAGWPPCAPAWPPRPT